MIAINNIRKLTLNFLKLRRHRREAIDNLIKTKLKPRLSEDLGIRK